MKTAREIAEGIADKWTRLDGEHREDVVEAMVEAIEAERAQRTIGEDEALDPDPRFPNRPTHPDFARLSSAIIAQDAEADMLGVNEAASIHLPSFAYLAKQRVGAALTHIDVNHELAVAALSLYLDAFQLGVGFTNRGGHRDLPTKTGTAGEGSSS